MRRTLHIKGTCLLGGIVAVLALAACTGGDGSGSATLGLGAPSTTTSTTEAAGTSPVTTAVAPSSTTPPQAPTTTPAPVYVDGIPQVRATPARAAVGNRVRIEGYGFVGDQWRQPGGDLWLAARQAPCALVAEPEASLTITGEGRLSGSFVVPATGNCRQGDAGAVALVGGTYDILFQCTACRIGQLELDAPAAPLPLRCGDVGFAPNSDNLATNITAVGIACPEAEAFVRKVGGPLGPINGPARTEADGWTCIRVGQDLSGLPTATYECTNGDRSITFRR